MKEILGNGVEVHGVGNHDLPEATGPEQFVDRWHHQQTYQALMLIEAELIKAKPELGSDGEFVRVVVDMSITGNVKVAVNQRYLDVGWRHVDITPSDTSVTTSVVLWFPN